MELVRLRELVRTSLTRTCRRVLRSCRCKIHAVTAMRLEAPEVTMHKLPGGQILVRSSMAEETATLYVCMYVLCTVLKLKNGNCVLFL